MLNNLTHDEFKGLVRPGGGTVVVDFWASWCRYCPPMQKTVEEVAPAYPAVHFGKVNTDDETDLTSSQSISGLPTVVVYHDGQEVTRLRGVQPAGTLRQVLDTLR